jgi:hypothetical protein
MATITDLTSGGKPQAIPLAGLLNIERRHGKDEFVIEKALVKMDSPAMKFFASRRDEWAARRPLRRHRSAPVLGPDDASATDQRGPELGFQFADVQDRLSARSPALTSWGHRLTMAPYQGDRTWRDGSARHVYAHSVDLICLLWCPRQRGAAALWSDARRHLVADLELGAIAIALRMKTESVDEMVGFLAAANERLPTLQRPSSRARPVVIPSYNGARRGANLTPLLALLCVAMVCRFCCMA